MRQGEPLGTPSAHAVDNAPDSAARAAEGASTGLPFSPETERRLVRLMMGRFGLSLISFAIVVVLDFVGLGPTLSEVARRGLYWTLAFAFLATALSGLSFGRVRSATRFAVLQLVIDVTIVTLLVLFSGGHESVFSFLYVGVTAYGSLLFERRGAMAAACACSLAYAAALSIERAQGFGLWVGDGRSVHAAVTAATWGVHVGAFFLVGALASVLTGELRRQGAALVRSTHDLRRLRNLNARIVQSLESGLLTTDSEGRIGSFNPEAERITGIRAIDAVGTVVDEVIPGAWEILTQPSPEGGEPVRRQRLSFCGASRDPLHLGLAASLLRDNDGTPIGYVLIFQDVTEVVDMELELTRRERLTAAGELSAKIAHEIRNPLAAISGSVQILRDEFGQSADAAEPDEPARLMDIVVREADRLSNLITDFLGYARPRPPAPEWLALDELAEEVLHVLRGSCPSNIEVELVRDEAPGACEVKADAALVRQVLWNLFANGIQAMPEGGRLLVEVRARRGDAASVAGDLPQAEGRERRSEGAAESALEGVELVVEDTGVGIEADQMEHLFEPFFTTKSTGTGLGLATVHRIVEAHNGRLALDSKPGKGTRFSLLLPKTLDSGLSPGASEAHSA